MDEFQIEKPKVSVCIPVYNGEKYIALAIESVLRQTYKNFELIIIDNHSTDNTLIIAEGFKDSRIRIIKNNENIGARNNWNKALEEAKGEYIKLLPADDVLADECIEKQVKVFQEKENKKVVLITCLSSIINEYGRKIITRKRFMPLKGRVNGKNAIKRNIICGTNIIGEPGGVLFKKRVLEETGNFDDEYPYVIDLDLCLRILLEGDLYMINEVLCSFRVSNTSWSVLIGKKQKNDFWGFIDKIKKDKRYNLNFMDVYVGKIMALINSILRNLFYKYLLKNNLTQ